MTTLTPQDERALVRECLAGDRRAWDRLARTFAPILGARIEGTLRSYTGRADLQTVQDLVQDTFLNLLQEDAAALRRFQWECSLERYLSLVAVNRCVDFLRRQGVRSREPWAEATRSLLGDLPVDPASGALLAAESRERLLRALDALSPRERLALKWCYWDALPPQEMARLLGMEPGSLRSLLARARSRLAALLRGRSLFL